MSLSIKQWHQRYQEQSRWTASLREFIFSQINFTGAGTVLEMGCGTGAILSSLPAVSGQKRIGIDLLLDPLLYAKHEIASSLLTCADGYEIPLANATMDICFCHYLLLWLSSPLRMLQEMRRVCKPGGYVVALAEPDYAGRIDFPDSLGKLADAQTLSLVKQGVNPKMGRQLPSLFSGVDLKDIQYGISGFQKEARQIPDWFASEWQITSQDLDDNMENGELSKYRDEDEKYWQEGSRVLWVPTFYAYGHA